MSGRGSAWPLHEGSKGKAGGRVEQIFPSPLKPYGMMIECSELSLLLGIAVIFLALDLFD